MMTVTENDLQRALRHEHGLRRLAARLCRDPADADDAVQHAMSQVALGQRRATMPLLAFLRATVRNYATNLRTRAVRRQRRESAAAPTGGAPPVDEFIAREQLRAAVAGAVLALDEPYRTTVWLRWFEELPAMAVAERLDVPESTVRTRLQRAYVTLRRRLDRDYGDRRWLALAAPLPRGTNLGSVTTGAILMKKTITATVCMFALLLVAVSLIGDPTETRPDEKLTAEPVAARTDRVEPVARTRVDIVAPTPPPTPEATPGEPPADPTAAELAAFAGEAPPGTLDGVVLAGASPQAGGRAWLRAEADGGLPWGSTAEWDVAPNVHRTHIANDGTFRFESLGEGRYAVGVETVDRSIRYAWATVPAPPRPTRRLVFVLGSANLRGHVYADDGRKATGYLVAAWNYGRMPAGQQLIANATTDAEGAFEIHGLCAGTYRVAASPTPNLNDPQKRAITVEIAAGEHREVRLGTPQNGCTWEGRVLLPNGSPLTIGSLVQLELEAERERTDHRVDDDGTFRASVAAGNYRASIRFVQGTRQQLGQVELAPGALSRDLWLPRAIRIRPRFLAALGQARWPRTALVARLHRERTRSHESVHAMDGNLYLFGVEPGHYVLRCWPHPIAGAPSTGTPVTIPDNYGELELDVLLQRR